MTKREAAEKWIGEFNAIPHGMIEKLWKADIDDMHEVTKPRVGDYVFHHPSQESGEIAEVHADSEEYEIRIGKEIVRSTLDDFSVEQDSMLPMWGTLWSFGTRMDDYWLEEKDGIQLMSNCGFRIYEHEEFGYFFGIDGAGYDFYEAHWIPLYEARGLQWHDKNIEAKVEMANYQKMGQLFPDILHGDFRSLHLETEDGRTPLSVEWLDDNRLAIMMTFTQDGKLIHDPSMTFEIDHDTETAKAVEFRRSIPAVHQYIDKEGRQHISYNNGAYTQTKNMHAHLADYAADWMKNIEAQGYAPSRGIALRDGEETELFFEKEDKSADMDARELYDYIQENFDLDGTASRLIQNILDYVEAEDFVDAEDAHTHLWALLGGAFGLTKQELEQYRSGECEKPLTEEKPSLMATLKANDEKSREKFGGNTSDLTERSGEERG